MEKMLKKEGKADAAKRKPKGGKDKRKKAKGEKLF